MQIETERRETWCVLTILYVCLEVARASEDENERLALRAQISMCAIDCALCDKI